MGERKRFFRRGQFKLALLELLASEPMHGYQLIKAMEDKTGGVYSPSPGSIYPNLQLLEEAGWIAATEEEGKKLYRITEKGREALRQYGPVFDDHTFASVGEHRPDCDRGGKWERWRWRQLIMEQPVLIRLLAQAVDAMQNEPGTRRADELAQLMNDFRQKLEQLLDSNSTSGSD